VVVISFFFRVSHSSESRKRAFSFSARHSDSRAKPISRYRTSERKTRPMSPQGAVSWARGVGDVLCVPCRRSVVVGYRAFVGAFAPNERETIAARTVTSAITMFIARKANGNYR
jgi:hypothetical protein